VRRRTSRRRGRGELRDELFDASAYLVTDRADGVDALPGRVLEDPVLVADAGDEGARIFGVSAEMSMPSSSIAATTAGFTVSAGAEPAERTSTRPCDRCAR